MKRMILVLGLVGCTDVPQPFELDHARVMAVRVEPPALAPDAVGRIDVLVTDAERGPRLAEPATIVVTAPAGIEVVQVATGWEVRSPSAEELAGVRASLGLAADAEVIVPLAITVASSEGALAASKTIAFGAAAANPSAPALLVDGSPMGDRVQARADSSVAVAGPVAELSYRWFSSVGDLIGYTTSAVRFDDPPPGEGLLGVVVRDQAGGVAWTIAPAEVLP